MAFVLTPELLEMGLGRLGIAAAQLKAIDTDTKKAFIRLFMTAFETGDANGYLKQRLEWIEQKDSEPEPPPPVVRVSSRVVEGSFEPRDSDRPPRERRGR
jgi:hypothetical protein